MIITAGKFKGQKIAVPDESITRPTLSKVRMSIFNTLQSLIDFEGSTFLDMYGGSGVMSLEAVSRGFESALAIEKNPKAAGIIKNNFKKYGDLLELVMGDSIKVAPKLEKKFDVIYIDPPYFSGIYEQSLEAVKNLNAKIIILEHVTDVDFKNYKIIKQKRYGDKLITYLHGIIL